MTDQNETQYSSTKYLDGPDENGNTFSSSIPPPKAPKKHIITPSVYSDNAAYNKIGRSSSYQKSKHTHNSYRRPGYYSPTSDGMVFRSADNTQRALAELAKRRHEAREKRRATTLLIGLLSFAWCVHYITMGEQALLLRNDSKGGANKNVDGKTDGMSAEDFISKGSGEKDVVSSKEGKEAVDEEIIPPDKEFLRPLQNFASIKSPRRASDTNFFFHIPRSGGQTIKDIAGKCLRMTLASEVGVRDGHGQDPNLKVVQINEANYVNVDTTSLEGLNRATSLGLADSNMADMITSSYFETVSMLFDKEHKGRAFTLFRHPIERAVSMYYQRIQGDNADLDSSITLEAYAQGNGIENNWITRFLTNKMEGDLTKEHLEQAKDILQEKFLVGFLDDSKETMYRVMKYFDWSFNSDETKQMEQEDCIHDLLKDGSNINVNGYELPKKGTQAYALITWQTQLDIKLYDFAKELFDEQTRAWGSKERKKELKKKKKEESNK